MLQALEGAEKRLQKETNYHAIPIARAVVAWFGSKAKQEWFIPFWEDPVQPAPISKRTAQTFMRLLKAKQIPDHLVWALGEKIESIRRTAKAE